MLNAVSWGILMPTGAIIARYLKVFKSADPAWFYLHVTCQASAYVVGVAGFGTGLKLGSDSEGVEYDTHRALGIVLFCLGTLQVRHHLHDLIAYETIHVLNVMLCYYLCIFVIVNGYALIQETSVIGFRCLLCS